MKAILGSGLIGMLARDILGDGWTIIPQGRSRFYSFLPALADNYVAVDEVINEYMDKFTYLPIIHKTAFSIGGELTYNKHIALSHYLEKLYGSDIPPHAQAFWKSRSDTITSYGDCVNMYRMLHKKYEAEVVKNAKEWGFVDKIEDHTIIGSTGKKAEYDRIVNTIPMDALLELMGEHFPCPCGDTWYYHLRTKSLDLEGATHIYVADPEIEFYKATKLTDVDYLFYAKKQIKMPGSYFNAWIDKFDLVAETNVDKAVPHGPIPDLPAVKDADITCMGRSAVWDDCLDVGSCIKRLLKFQ